LYAKKFRVRRPRTPKFETLVVRPPEKFCLTEALDFQIGCIFTGDRKSAQLFVTDIYDTFTFVCDVYILKVLPHITFAFPTRQRLHQRCHFLLRENKQIAGNGKFTKNM
jgi:hypothetical protein